MQGQQNIKYCKNNYRPTMQILDGITLQLHAGISHYSSHALPLNRTQFYTVSKMLPTNLLRMPKMPHSPLSRHPALFKMA